MDGGRVTVSGPEVAFRCGAREFSLAAAAGEAYVALIAIMAMKSAAKIAFLFKLHFLPAFRIVMRDQY